MYDDACFIANGFMNHNSSFAPNLQQLPRQTEIDIRGCFTAGKGNSLIVLDFSQEEIRLAAALSKDIDMINAYKNGLDLHLLTANKIFNLGLTEEQLKEGTEEYKKAKEKYKAERTKAKTIVFGMLYGMTEYTLSKNLKISLEEALKLISDYFEAYHGVKKSIDECHRQIKHKGFIRNYYGRYRRFKPENGAYKAEHYKQGYNFLIQGTAADLLRVSMNNLLKFLKANGNEGKIVLTVHDEICIEVPSNNAEFYLKNMKEIMEKSLDIEPALIAEGSIGKTYSEAK